MTSRLSKADKRDTLRSGTRRCLVTGGSGFVGTHLLRSLMADPDVERVVVLDLLPPAVSDPRIEYWPCDLRIPIDVDPSRYADLDTCYHLAALCKEPGFHWDEYYRTNYTGTRNLVEFIAKAGITHLLFTSTTMVFRSGEERLSEESLTAPDTAYGISKILAEVHIEGWQSAGEGRRLRIIRPGVVFGRGEGANFTRLYYALSGNRFAYVGRRNTIKGCIYVKDLVRLLALLTDDPGGRATYNAVYPDPYTIEQICAAFCRVFGMRRRIPTIPFRIALAASYAFELLGFLGLRTSIHHRRIEKLYYSTNASAEPARTLGLPMFPLEDAIADWRSDCGSKSLF